MSTQAIQALGWSLIHFLWQGALVALLLEVALFLLRDRSPRARYALRGAALFVMGLLPLVTWAWLVRAGAPVPAGLELVIPEAAPERIEECLAAVLAAEEAARRAAPLGWLVAAWALGASLCAARTLRGYVQIRRLQSSAAGHALPPAWQVRFDFLARRVRVRATARVVESAALAAPAVIGWLEPIVLIPARALTGLSGAELELVLAHELAHVARADYLINLLQSALEALLFYHPAVWWVSHGIRAEREFCCDDAALARSSDGAVYARALATLEGWRSVQPAFGLSTLGGPLMIRIQRLLGIRPSFRPVRGPLTALGALLALGCATAMAHDPAEGRDPERLVVLRKQIEEMQQRLDELRASLDEAQGTETVMVDMQPLEEHAQFRVAIRGDGEAECDGEDECGAREQAHESVRAVVVDRDWAGEALKGKIHAHLGDVHEHLKQLMHGDAAHDEVDGEATIEIIIQTDGDEPRHFKKVVPLGGNGFKMFWHGDDEADGEEEGRVLRFDLHDAIKKHHSSLGGLHPLLWNGAGDENVHVLELKELLKDHGEHLEHVQKLHGLLEGKLKALPKKIKILRSTDDEPVLIEIDVEDEPEEESEAGAGGADSEAAGELV